MEPELGFGVRVFWCAGAMDRILPDPRNHPLGLAEPALGKAQGRGEVSR